MRTTSFSWMLGLLIAAAATSRFESRTRRSRSRGVSQHRAADLLRDRHHPEPRVERQELLVDDLVAGLLVEAVRVLDRGDRPWPGWRSSSVSSKSTSSGVGSDGRPRR